MQNCIFCKIAQHEVEHNTIWEDEEFIAFLDKHPQQRGHVLLIPKAHHEDIFDMPEELYGEIFKRAKMLGGVLKMGMNSQRVAIVVAGFSVSHVHVHLVPVEKESSLDSDKKFFSTKLNFRKLSDF